MDRETADILIMLCEFVKKQEERFQIVTSTLLAQRDAIKQYPPYGDLEAVFRDRYADQVSTSSTEYVDQAIRVLEQTIQRLKAQRSST